MEGPNVWWLIFHCEVLAAGGDDLAREGVEINLHLGVRAQRNEIQGSVKILMIPKFALNSIKAIRICLQDAQDFSVNLINIIIQNSLNYSRRRVHVS
jgi:hypothetical protein